MVSLLDVYSDELCSTIVFEKNKNKQKEAHLKTFELLLTM